MNYGLHDALQDAITDLLEELQDAVRQGAMHTEKKVNVVQHTRQRSLVVGLAGPQMEEPNLYSEVRPTVGCASEEDYHSPDAGPNKGHYAKQVDEQIQLTTGVLVHPSWLKLPAARNSASSTLSLSDDRPRAGGMA
ncbi:hypothetical protein [Natrarchaeobaculum sulfurireducens]|uniref:hypothetical protein n=1 Tax=Natrarchaeobaculum sulfurireducens TaxID=2044521 RepID=UPI00105AB083|nr:hypothetical protein [Natrarchaeobaculum sulfurireducens]